jgi:myo-inositol 2-dehydrogenase/D-chiro-inositol 1-dehydrogenase
MDVITDPDVDAVWICSPVHSTPTRSGLVPQTASTYFAKKPIATELTETSRAINACNAAGESSSVVCSAFDLTFKRVQEAVVNKKLVNPS